MKLRFLGLLPLALGVLVGPGTSPAAEVGSLYTAEVPFDANAQDARTEAYDAALQQVLLRVSGPALLEDRDLYDALFPDPSAYVVQFQPGPDETLIVTFDGAAVEKTLRDANQTVWGGNRPLTLVWLAVDWGQGERAIIAAAESEQPPEDPRVPDPNAALRDRLLEAAAERGLPIAFPLLDSEDMARVEFSDVWGGFGELILDASQRYAADSILIGRMNEGGGGSNRWTYLFGGQQHQWTGAPETAMAEIAGLLAAEFAVGGDEPLRDVDLDVYGITSVDAYADVQNLLADVNVIDSFTLTEVAGDRVRYRVRAHGGGVRLARALRFAGLLEQERIDMSGFAGDERELDALEFFYNGP